VSVTNNNSAACPTAGISLGQSLPAGFSGSLSAPSLSLASGAGASSNWSVSSAATVMDATYSISASATETTSGMARSAPASDIVYTALTCTRAAPAVSASPSSLSGNAGATLLYTVTVTNKNSTACGSSSFNLNHLLPSGFSATFGATSLTLEPGASASSSWSVSSTSSVGAGTYSVAPNAVDSVSGTQGSTTASDVIMAIDTAAPVLSIDSPAAGATLGRRNIALAATANDASGVQAVEFYVDGVLLVRDTGAPYSATWNARKAALGSHTLKVRALDNAGNAAEKSISVTLQ
jgi:hypothetical protein